MTNVNMILDRLDKLKANGKNKWTACCPAHNDKSPSLSIKDDGERILIHCFAGCSNEDVVAAIGLNFSDLFADSRKDYDLKKRRKKGYRAVIESETLFLKMAKSNVEHGFVMTADDQKRIELAMSHIKQARAAINES